MSGLMGPASVISIPHPFGHSSMTVTVTMTIPLRASRASQYPPGCSSPSTSVPTHILCCVQRPYAVGSASRSFILTCFFFKKKKFNVFFPPGSWLSKLCGRIAHHCTQLHGMARPTLVTAPLFSCPVRPFCSLPSTLQYPRVHRPPKSREACKDHGASEWEGSGSKNTHTQPNQAAWLDELCRRWDLG